MMTPSMSQASAAANMASAAPADIAEVPTNMETEVQLMEALTSIPVINKAIARPSASCKAGVDLTVSLCPECSVRTFHQCPSLCPASLPLLRVL